MDDLFVLLFLAGLGAFFYFRKKDTQKRNTAVGVAVVSAILIIVFSDENIEEIDTSVAVEQVGRDEENRRYYDEIEETEEVSAEVSDENAEVREETNEDETSFDSLLADTHIESYQSNSETEIVIVQAPITEVFSSESAVEGFNQEMWMTLREYHELFSDGVFYLGYGDRNGEEMYKLAAYFSGETLNQINFDEVILESSSIVYADRYYISGFGDLDVDFPTNKDGAPLVEGDPVDELWFRETTGVKRELSNN